MVTSERKFLKHIVVSESELLELPPPTYRCELCGFSVKTKANLRAHHIKTHRILRSDADLAFYTKQKCQITSIYHCPVVPCKHNIGCGAGFSKSSRLKQHYQNVHMQKSFSCQRCGDQFATPTNHAYHVRFCGTVFTCPVCTRRYSFKKHLDQHFRRSGHRPDNKKVSSSDKYPKQSGKHQPKQQELSQQSQQTDLHNTVASQICLVQPILVPLVILPVQLLCSSVENVANPAHTTAKTFSVSQNRTGSASMYNDSNSTTLTQPLSNAHLMLEDCGSQSVNALSSVLRLFTNVSQDSPLGVDNSTQTEMAPVASCTTVVDTVVESVSVNTGTDEDDITAFIGSLFCDAGVETSFPISEAAFESRIVDSNCEISHACKFDPDCSPRSAADHDSDVFQQSVNDLSHRSSSRLPTGPACTSTSLFSTESVDEEIQTSFLNSTEQVSMQTDVILRSNVSAATHDLPGQWNRLLETPPPFFDPPIADITSEAKMSHSKTMLSPHLPATKCSTDCSAFCSPLGSFSPSAHSTACSGHSFEAADYRLDKFDRNLRDEGVSETHAMRISSHSIGLQSSGWLFDRACCSIASQTLSNDLDSWLNSVHTQTSTSPFGLHSFTDMCVGVDEKLFDAALESLSMDETC